MNDAKKGKAKTAAKGKTPKGGQSNKKPAKAKSAGAAKSSAGKGSTAATKTATKVFRVDVKKGPVRQVSRVDAIKDALRSGTFSEGALNTMLDRGDVIPSPDYFYATTKEALRRWAIDESAGEKKETEIAIGDLLYSEVRGLVGEVQLKEGEGLRVFFNDPASGTRKSVALTSKWVPASKEQVEEYKKSLALEKDQAAEVEVIPALTDDEKAELAEREKIIITNIEATENASMVIGENLKEISSKQLWRESVDPSTNQPYKRFGDYAVDKFGFTREYAQNLAQIAGYHGIALEVAPAKLKDAGLSVNATNALVRSSNKLMKELGLDDIEGFEDLRGMITGTVKILADVAPKDKRTGKPLVTPRLVTAVNDTIADIVKSGSVEIEGKQMSISDAIEKGTLGALAQNQIIETVAEGIKANRQTITDAAKEAYERAITPGRPVGTGQGPAKPFYSGTVPNLKNTSCEKHGKTEIVSIGNGTLQTKCKCRWRIDSESGKLVCFEVNGRLVKPPTK